MYYISCGFRENREVLRGERTLHAVLNALGRGVGPATALVFCSFWQTWGKGPGSLVRFFRPWDKWAKQYRIIGCVCEREREKLIVAELNRSCHFALHLTSQATAFSAWASQGGSSPTAPDRDPRWSSGKLFPECQWFVLIPPPRGRGQDEIENLFLYYVISCRDCYIIGSQKSKGLGREVTLPMSWVTTHSFIVKQQKPLSPP